VAHRAVMFVAIREQGLFGPRHGLTWFRRTFCGEARSSTSTDPLCLPRIRECFT
jgi:hypothetical protein